MSGKGRAAGRTADSSSSRTAGTPAETPDEALLDQQATIESQRAEIERLSQLLEQAQSRPVAPSDTSAQLADQTASNRAVETLVETLVRTMERSNTPGGSGTTKSAKIPDPPMLTDGKDPTFESWKLQMRGKLRTNSDHFQSEEAKMTYVFSRTGGDAQKHLQPRYDEDSQDLYSSGNDMLDHLTAIFEDPHKVQNARIDYRALMMKPTETFATFYTRFQHLAGQARIPQADLQPDLYEKLTTDLQEVVLPVRSTLTTLKSLSDQCLSLDQGLRRIKARKERFRARTTASTDRKPSDGSPGDRKTAAGARNPPRNASAAPAATTGGTTTDQSRLPSYRQRFNDARLNALAAKGACYNCGQPGHISAECPEKEKNAVVQEVEVEEETEARTDSGKVEP